MLTGRELRSTLAVLAAALAGAGCTDSFTVTAPYEWVWQRSTQTLEENGFRMVTVPDAERLVPASSEPSGRAWFLATALPDPAGWEAPRVVQVSIAPVEPRDEAPRRITVEVEKRDWVVHGNLPDPELRSRVVWLLKQALDAPRSAPPDDPPRMGE